MSNLRVSMSKAALVLMGCVLLNSCQVEDLNSFTSGKGSVALNLSTSTTFDVKTKAVDESAYKIAGNYTVNILKAGTNEVVNTFKYADKPASISLDNGAYTIKAFYGSDAQPASRTDFYVVGSANFNVNGETNKAVSVACKPTYGKVITEFTNMDTYFSDYYVVYTTSKVTDASVKWLKGDNATTPGPWYLKLNEGGEKVTATIHIVPKNEYQTKAVKLVKEYQLAPNQAWTLKVSPSYNNTTGQLGVAITIDETTNDVPVDIIIPSEWI